MTQNVGQHKLRHGKQKQCSTSTSAHVASVMKFGFSLSVYLWESVVVRFVVIDFIGVFCGFCVAHLLVVCVVYCFVCLRPVFCVPNVSSVSRLSMLDCPFGCL